MSGELGFQNAETFRDKIYRPLQEYRGSDGTPGCECSLIEFLNDELGMTNAAGNSMTMPDIWDDLALDPDHTTVDNLLGLSGDLRYIAPEMIRQAIWMGIQSNQSYLDLCRESLPAASLHVVQPRLYVPDDLAKMQPVGEAEWFPEGEVTWDTKSIRISKFAQGISMSDELILSTTVSQLDGFLERVGVLLGAKLFRNAVTTLRDGDQTDGSDACKTVGVDDTSKAPQFVNFLRVWTRGHMIVMSFEDMITSEEMANAILAIPQFQGTMYLGRLVELSSRNQIIPSNMGHHISSDMDDDDFILFDKRFGLQHYQFRGLMVESERIVQKQIQGTYVSVMEGFMTLLPHARVLVDTGATIQNAPWSAIFNPIV